MNYEINMDGRNKVRIVITCAILFFFTIDQLHPSSNNFTNLIADHHAREVGDLLTVIVIETANAQSSADLASGKDIKFALQGGYTKDLYHAGLTMSGQGKANASTERNGKIKASLTVRILKILTKKHYVIAGEQAIQINGEQQKISLSGIVREEDINAQNTILSTRLANAKISYTGDGSISNAEKKNYLYKIMSFIGLL